MPNEAHARPEWGNSVVIVRESAPQLILPYAYETHNLPFNLSADGLSRSSSSRRSIRLFKSPSLRSKQLPLSADPWLCAQPHSPKSYVIAQPRRRADELQSNRHRLLGKSTPYAELERHDLCTPPLRSLSSSISLDGPQTLQDRSPAEYPLEIPPTTPSSRSRYPANPCLRTHNEFEGLPEEHCAGAADLQGSLQHRREHQGRRLQ